MTAIRVRPAVERDETAMVNMLLDGFKASYADFMPAEFVNDFHEQYGATTTVRKGMNHATVAEIDGRVVGFIIIAEDMIEELWVSPKTQRSGVGAKLMASAEQIMRLNNVVAARLYCYGPNKPARAFYEKLGYTEADRFMSREVRGGPVPVLIYAKTIAEPEP